MTEAHIEIYKRYRPTTWKGLIGQENVAKSLRSAVKANKIPTSYLFAGPRGCGKTSAALILAKAINCLNLREETADPCNECDVCVAIDEGRQIGVTYVSAAQYSGVEDVKRLMAEARLSTPVRKQVFIIDEVHNLKGGKGFEALLIPLEQKDMPAVFIFCTTEIEKVPATIISRVQSRRFNLVDAQLMTRYVQHIVKKEQLELTPEQIADAVRRGKGSVRDTLTSLESISETGETSVSLGAQLIEAIAAHNMAEVLSVVAKTHSDGQDARDVAEQLFEDLRDLLLYSAGVEASLLGVIPVEDPAKVVEGLLGKAGIIALMDPLGEAITLMAAGGDARIHLEVGLIKGFNRLKQRKKAVESRG